MVKADEDTSIEFRIWAREGGKVKFESGIVSPVSAAAANSEHITKAWFDLMRNGIELSGAIASADASAKPKPE